MMIKNSEALGCDDIVSAEDIVTGNEKVNLFFVAELFGTKYGLNSNYSDHI